MRVKHRDSSLPLINRPQRLSYPRNSTLFPLFGTYATTFAEKLIPLIKSAAFFMYLDSLWCWWRQWSLATSKTPSTSKPQRSSTSKPNVTPPKPRLQWEKSTTYQRDQNSHTDKSSSYPIEAKINYKKLWFEKIKSKHPHRLRKYEKVETKQPLIHFSSAPQPFFNQMSKATALRLLRDCPSHRDGHEVGKAIKTLWLAAITT